jgi:hypothetical protein
METEEEKITDRCNKEKRSLNWTEKVKVNTTTDQTTRMFQGCQLD